MGRGAVWLTWLLKVFKKKTQNKVYVSDFGALIWHLSGIGVVYRHLLFIVSMSLVAMVTVNHLRV